MPEKCTLVSVRLFNMFKFVPKWDSAQAHDQNIVFVDASDNCSIKG